MKESKFQKIVIKRLERVGCFVFNVHGHAMQQAGIPDLYIAHPKFHGWLELKCNARKLDPLQKDKMGKLVKRGVPAFELHHYDGEGVCICNHEGKVFDQMDNAEWNGDDLTVGVCLLAKLGNATGRLQG